MPFRLPEEVLYFRTPDLSREADEAESISSLFLSRIPPSVLRVGDGIGAEGKGNQRGKNKEGHHQTQGLVVPSTDGSAMASRPLAAHELQAEALWRKERTHTARSADHIPSEKERARMEAKRKRMEGP